MQNILDFSEFVLSPARRAAHLPPDSPRGIQNYRNKQQQDPSQPSAE
jgi:hypothetical protein